MDVSVGVAAAKEPEDRSGGDEETSRANKKAKKRKPARPDKKSKKRKAVKRETGPNYTIQEGEDMLLIISNTSSTWTPKRRAPKKRRTKAKTTTNTTKTTTTKTTTTSQNTNKRTKAKTTRVRRRTQAPVAVETEVPDQWSENLPEEVLVKIFHFAVVQDGAVPFLCRVARVCRAWHRAAACPSLWWRVSIGTELGLSRFSETQRKETVDWLARERFSQLREFSLFHWKKCVDYVVQKVAESSTRLQSLKLSSCKTVTADVFHDLGLHCRSLESLNLQHSEFHVDGLVSFLQDHGTQIKSLCFTHSHKSEKILSVLYRGCCPELRLMEINAELDAGGREIHICVQALQIRCSKLQTFRLMNLTLVPKMVRNTPSDTPGFPLLEELSIATTAYSTLTNCDLLTLLHGSPCLRVLDLRGAFHISPEGLCRLPCENLECLYWGLYSKSNFSCDKNLHKVAMKWRNTLRELDLSNQAFSEEEMSLTVKNLLQTDGVVSLSSIKLNGTTITPSTLRELISKAPGLKYLNVSSCRNLPRGLKRLYQDREDIRQLCEQLQ